MRNCCFVGSIHHAISALGSLSELPNLGRPDIRRTQQERQTSVRRAIEERPKNLRTDAWNDVASLPFQCCNLNHWEAGEKAISIFNEAARHLRKELHTRMFAVLIDGFLNGTLPAWNYK